MDPGQQVGIHSDRPLLGYEAARLVVQLGQSFIAWAHAELDRDLADANCAHTVLCTWHLPEDPGEIKALLAKVSQLRDDLDDEECVVDDLVDPTETVVREVNKATQEAWATKPMD